MNVEWLILADSAQVIGNKLYLLGGGWDSLRVNTGFPVQRHLAVAASFRCSWNETNQKNNFEVEILTQDGETVGKVSGQFEVGRPPGIPPGQDQRMQMAVDMGLTFQQPGGYIVVARIEGEEGQRVPFNVVEMNPTRQAHQPP